MRPISYEVDGFPEFIRSESGARKAIERGAITPDTLVIAYGDNGERERIRAADHPVLAPMLAPAAEAPAAEPAVTEAPVDEPPPDPPAEQAAAAPEQVADAPASAASRDARAAPPPPPPPPPEPRVEPVVVSDPPQLAWLWGLAGALFVLFIIFRISSMPGREVPVATTSNLTEASDVMEAAPTPEVRPEDLVTLYATRGIAVRTQASATSERITLLPRGTEFTGVLIPSISDSQYSWLRITAGSYAGRFVSQTNLSREQPPELDTSEAGNWYLTQDYTALSRPASDASQMPDAPWRMTSGQQVEVAGVTGRSLLGSGWAEIMLPKQAGVGYVPFDALTRTSPDTIEDLDASNATVAAEAPAAPPAEPARAATYSLRLVSKCPKPLGLLLRYRTPSGVQLRTFHLQYNGSSVLASDQLVDRDIYFTFYWMDGGPNFEEGTLPVTYQGRSYRLRSMKTGVSGSLLTSSFTCTQ